MAGGIHRGPRLCVPWSHVHRHTSVCTFCTCIGPYTRICKLHLHTPVKTLHVHSLEQPRGGVAQRAASGQGCRRRRPPPGNKCLDGLKSRPTYRADSASESSQAARRRKEGGTERNRVAIVRGHLQALAVTSRVQRQVSPTSRLVLKLMEHVAYLTHKTPLSALPSVAFSLPFIIIHFHSPDYT